MPPISIFASRSVWSSAIARASGAEPQGDRACSPAARRLSNCGEGFAQPGARMVGAGWPAVDIDPLCVHTEAVSVSTSAVIVRVCAEGLTKHDGSGDELHA